MSMSILIAYNFMYRVCAWCTGIQKRGSEALELELQAVVSCYMDTGKQISPSATISPACPSIPVLGSWGRSTPVAPLDRISEDPVMDGGPLWLYNWTLQIFDTFFMVVAVSPYILCVPME